MKSNYINGKAFLICFLIPSVSFGLVFIAFGQRPLHDLLSTEQVQCDRQNKLQLKQYGYTIYFKK